MTTRYQAWAGESPDTMRHVATRPTREAAQEALDRYIAERAASTSSTPEQILRYVRTAVRPHPDDVEG